MSDHLMRVQTEFSRQAETMSAAAIFTNEQVLARIQGAAALTSHMRVLDVACGPGIVSQALAHNARNIVAYDITPTMLIRARQRCVDAGLTNVHPALGQAEILPFGDDTFDVVVTRSAIHHFPDPATVIAEMARVTQPSGHLVIVDVVASENAEEATLHNALETIRDPSHARMLPQREILYHLEEAGIEIETTLAWTHQREFDEWLQITNAPERIAPLRVIMNTLASAGIMAGINLHLEAGKIVFEHHSRLIVGMKPAHRHAS